jgi:hypothetical protein
MRFTGFDDKWVSFTPLLTDKIVAMHARGMTVREIRRFLAEQYGTDVSADFITRPARTGLFATKRSIWR